MSNKDNLILELYIELLKLSVEETTDLEAEIGFLLCQHPHIQKIIDNANNKG